MRFSQCLVLACLSLPFVNCQTNGPDPYEETLSNKASFAAATETEKRYAIERALGLDATLALFAGFDADYASTFGKGCPQRSISDSTVTYSGEGCTTDAGQTYTGWLVATNMPSFNADLGSANSEPMTLEFMDWSNGEDLPLTGRLWQSESQPTTTYQTEMDLSLGEGVTSTVSLKMDCEIQEDGEAAKCKTNGDVELATIGSYGVSGEVMLGNATSSGAIVLSGEDQLRVDFDNVADGCAPILVDDAAAGSFCKDSLKEEKEESSLSIEGHSVACEEGTVMVEVYSNLAGIEAQVHAYAPGEDISELRTLRLNSTQNGTKTFKDEFRNEVLPCSELDQINFVFRVFDANNYTYCAAFGPDKETFLQQAECDARYLF